MTPVVYPGSFDPVTNGHVNLIARAARTFGDVIVAVATNVRKTGYFTTEERMEMLREATAHLPGVQVDSFEGLLVDYMVARGIRVSLRGLRAISDFEYEFQMAHMNHKLSPGLETVFLVAGSDEFFISSNVVKEVALLGGSVDGLVPEGVKRRLYAKLGREVG